jgi:hypothetical protein
MSGARAKNGLRITFIMNGKQRRVRLASVAAVHRGGRLVVPLIDLWVASQLPGDLPDMEFEIVAEGVTDDGVAPPAIAGPSLPRAYLEVQTRRLWWDGPRNGLPHGRVVRSVVIRESVAGLNLTGSDRFRGAAEGIGRLALVVLGADAAARIGSHVPSAAGHASADAGRA